MSNVIVEKNPDQSKLDQLGVDKWPIWTKEASQFPWEYDADETCYLLEGEVTVTSQDGEVWDFAKGDLVTFKKGLACFWDIKKNVKKHYQFS